MHEHFNPHDMRAEDWREVAIFLANAISHLVPSQTVEFVRLKDAMQLEWSSGDRFGTSWDVANVVEPDDVHDYPRVRQLRELLPEPLYQAFVAAHREHSGDAMA